MANLRCPAGTMLALLLFLICSSVTPTALGYEYELSNFSRSGFPPGFLFGAASSAYQYEGAAFEDGKGPSIWDNFTHRYPEKILDRSNGDVAMDFYHRYKGDVKIMKYLGLDVFRMSISWPRILPRGSLSGGVNQKGIDFYRNVFKELIANGVTPFVTLFHWDLPQELEDQYRGFLSPLIVNDFRDYVELCFKEFGDLVKYWLTANEPFSFTDGGYDGGFIGNLAPYRCSPWANCPQGNSATEPYIVGHHLLLCHAEAVKVYKEKFQATQKGKIGIALVTHWFTPYSNSTADVRAAKRVTDFIFGWFTDPVVHGDYPKVMRSILGNRLPNFTDDQRKSLKGSFDFLGINYYTGNYASYSPSNAINVSSNTDYMAKLTTSKNGVPIGQPTGVGSFFVYPEGLRKLLVYVKDNYNNPTIYITENGIGDSDKGTIEESVTDPQRIDFYNRHLKAVQEAIGEGVKVKGFLAWSFLDCYEWNSGYTLKFGICHVDFQNNLTRTVKNSGIWFKNSLQNK
ncbi:beta-glucosidase 13-like [Primulina huaijiensis]|uniref:beta-glucosidase 13-like n=1 Tax=Primulina huaijiensis TaxID=1492673 RepID=UPI003CC71960